MVLKIAQTGVVFAVSCLMACLFISTNSWALDVPAQPSDIPIVDQTVTLTDEQKAALAGQIAAERSKSGNQIAIVIIPTLENESIEDYSLAIARKWGIGTKENNNGVLLLIAKNDRQVRIEVGTGLEGSLTDVQSGRIIRDSITPSFKDGNYYEGIRLGLGDIIAAINGEYTAAPSANGVATFPWEFIIAGAIFGFSWLGSILARTRSWWAGGVIGGVAGAGIGLVSASIITGLISIGILAIVGLLFDKFVSENYRSHAQRGEKPSWWAGGGTLGGGSSGGFGGFGGGGFGGGGSSGSW